MFGNKHKEFIFNKDKNSHEIRRWIGIIASQTAIKSEAGEAPCQKWA
jgi:hypothetical protein